jgi:hypothetical protein
VVTHPEEAPMELFCVSLLLVFFIASWGLVRLCGRLR